MNGIKFIEPTQKMEFEQKEYLIANYDIANKLFSSKEIPYFAFDFALEPISTVWIQTLEINQDTQAFTFVDYVKLDSSKLHSNYFEAYTHSTEILKGLYRIVFKNDVSTIYKVSYNLLNYYQFVIPELFFQELFNLPIDFENNTVPDNIGANNADASGSYAMVNDVQLPVLTPKSNFIDGQDFTFFFKIEFFKNDHRILAVIGTDKDNFLLEFRSSRMIVLYIKGYSTQHILDIQGWHYVGEILWALSYKKSTNTFKLFKNGAFIKSHSEAVNIAGVSNFTGEITTIKSKIEYHSLTYIKEELSEAEILSIGSNDLLVRNAAINRPQISHHWRFTEGIYNNIVVDEIGGVECDVDFSTQGISPTKKLYNLQYGFDLYTLDSDPTQKLYVSLKSDSTSFGKIISGYTFVETVTQNGTEFLNCETKLSQPNVQGLKDLDTYNLYFDILGNPIQVDFETLHNYSQDNVIMTKTTNKITNLKLKL